MEGHRKPNWEPFAGGGHPDVVADKEAQALLMATPPRVYIPEDATKVEACPELGLTMDGGGILLASSSFSRLLGDSAFLCSSSSVLFLLPLESAFAHISEGGTVLGSQAEFKPKSQLITYSWVIEPLTYNLLQGRERFWLLQVGPSDTALEIGCWDKTVSQCKGHTRITWTGQMQAQVYIRICRWRGWWATWEWWSCTEGWGGWNFLRAW